MTRRAVVLAAAVLAGARFGGASSAAGAVSFEECERRLRGPGSATDVAHCFAMVAGATGRWDEVTTRLDGLLALHPKEHRVRLVLAKLEADRGRSRARDLFRAAVDGFAASGDSGEEAAARIDLSVYLALRGEVGGADAELARAEALAQDSGDPVLIAEVHIQQAWQAYRRADFGAGELLLKRIEEDLFPDGPARARSLWLSAMGAIEWATGRYVEARNRYESQADLSRARGDLYEEASALSNVTLVNGLMLRAPTAENRESLLKMVHRTLHAARIGGNRPIEARSLLYLAQLDTDTRQKRQHTREGIARFRELGDVTNQLLGLRMLAASLVLAEPRDPGTGFALMEDAIEQARLRGDLEQVAYGRVGRANLEWSSHWTSGAEGPARQRAIALSLEALDAVEAIRDLQNDALVRARSFSRWTHAYDRLVGNLMWPPQRTATREDFQLAFEVLERKRGRVLVDELDAAHATPALASGGAADARARVLTDIVQIQRRLMAPDLVAGERAGLLHDLEQREVEDGALRQELFSSDARLAAVRRPRLPTLDELESALDENEAVLSYHVAGEWDPGKLLIGGSLVLVHTRRGTSIARLPPERDIEEAVALYLGLLPHRNGTDEAAAVRLHRLVLQPALELVPSQVGRIVILPDRALNHLPFAALTPAPGGEPAGVRYAISIAPSATVWLRLRQETVPVPQGVLVMVDPDLTSPEGARRGDDSSAAGAERSAVLSTAGRLGPLPHTRREARSIRGLVGRTARILSGREASERTLKSSVPGRYGILHIAAHALVDGLNPQRAAIVLAPGADDEDGLLQPREILGLDLSGRVVVLSACSSASGAVLEGEGVLGLSRPFFVGGAGAVVGNLWPVRDEEAWPLIEAYYRHLVRGRTLAEALQAAVRERIAAGAPPAAWAGLVIHGNGDLIPFPGGRTEPPTVFPVRIATTVSALVAAAIIAGLLLTRLRARPPLAG